MVMLRLVPQYGHAGRNASLLLLAAALVAVALMNVYKETCRCRRWM